MPRTPKKASLKKLQVALQTELGIKIPALPSHKMAEEAAKLREQYDDLGTKVESRKIELQKQMQKDEVEQIYAKGPGGTLYSFERQRGEEKLKISKPAAA